MALRDIFDGDPRSKDQLREEIRVHGKMISDLSRQIEELGTQSKSNSLETVNLREQLQSERLRTADLIDQLSKAQAADCSTGASDPVNVAYPTVDVADVPQEDADGAFHVVPIEAVGRQGKTLLLQQLSAQINVIRDEKFQSLFEENGSLKQRIKELGSEVDALRAEIEERRHVVGWTPSDIRRLEDRERIVIRNFAELMRREDLLMRGTDHSGAAIASATQDTNEQTQKFEQSILKLGKQLAEAQSQLKAKDDVLANQKAILDTKEIELAAIRSGVGSDEWGRRREAEKRDEELESLQYQLDRKLLEYRAQVVKLEKRAADDGIEVGRLQKSLAGKDNEIKSMSDSIDKYVEEAESLKSEVATLEAVARRTAIQLQGHNAKNSNLKETILAWMFAETYPVDLQIEHGYLHLMGDGPWDNDTFGRLMEGQNFSLWQLPDADIAHLVVGRNNWNEDDLIAQIAARQGQTLRIYSQEMWFAAMATGRDPFDADDPNLLQAFANGHKALEFLIGQEMPWPNVLDQPLGDVTDPDVGELGVVESPMHLMNYRVGKTSPHSEDERHVILDEIFLSRKLPFGDDCSPTYRANWGTPKSAQRLYRMARHIKFIVDGPNGSDYRKPVAREDWINDLAWLKKTYFRKTVHAFKWPDTLVP